MTVIMLVLNQYVVRNISSKRINRINRRGSALNEAVVEVYLVFTNWGV